MAVRTVTLGVSSLDDTKARLRAARRGKPQADPPIGLVSQELLWHVLSPNRYAILQAMAGVGLIALRRIERRVG